MTAIPDNGIYLHWDRLSRNTDVIYQIMRSRQIDGNYTEVGRVNYPTDEFVDTTGTPASLYYINELKASDETVLTKSKTIVGEEQLVLQSLYDQLRNLLNIPVYDEEAIFGRDRSTARFAYDTWNYLPKPEIRITGSTGGGSRDAMIILDEIDPTDTTTVIGGTYSNGSKDYPNGLTYNLDYQGKIYFQDQDGAPVSIQPYDTVYASYNVRLFTGTEINNAAYLALQSINAQPGANKYNSLMSAPYYYDPAIITGACYFLIRGLLLRLTNRELRLLIDDPGQNDWFSNLKELSGQYKEEFYERAEKLAIASYPHTTSIVTPEFMMPGGRSRFFRYVWKGEA